MNRYANSIVKALKREWPTILTVSLVGGIIFGLQEWYKDKESEADDAPVSVKKPVEESSAGGQHNRSNFSSGEEPRFGASVDLGKPSLEEVVVAIDHISYDKVIDHQEYGDADMPQEEISSLGYDEMDPQTGPRVHVDPDVISMDEGSYSVIGRRELNDLAASRELEDLQYFPDAEVIVGGEKWNTMVNDSMQETIENFIADNPAADEVYLREDGTDDDKLYHVLIRTGANYGEEVELHLDLMEIQDE